MLASGHRVQQVGIPHCGGTCSRPVLSVTYRHANFGSRVADTSYVVQEGKAVLGDTIEEISTTFTQRAEND